MGAPLRLLAIGHTKAAPVLLTAAEGEGAPRRYTLTEAEYRSLGSPAVGDTLKEEAADRLRALDAGHRARAAAFRILSFSDNNRVALTRKLRARGFSAPLAAEVVEEMVARGYIREGDQLERAVLSAAGKLWGPHRILAALVSKGYVRDEVSECLDRMVASGDVDFGEARRRLIEKKLGRGADPSAVRALLYRYGYAGSEE